MSPTSLFRLVILNNKLTILGEVDFLKPFNQCILSDDIVKRLRYVKRIRCVKRLRRQACRARNEDETYLTQFIDEMVLDSQIHHKTVNLLL